MLEGFSHIVIRYPHCDMPRHLSCEVENFVDAHLCPLRVMLRFVLVTRNRGIVLVDYHLCTLGSTILLTVAPLCSLFFTMFVASLPSPPACFLSRDSLASPPCSTQRHVQLLLLLFAAEDAGQSWRQTDYFRLFCW